MELNKNLQNLTRRAWALHDRISNETNKESIGFCRFCSECGCYCGIAETPLDERKRLIAIRDSLKDVENSLMSLQRLQSWQQIDQCAALSRLEESRLLLMHKVTQHQGRVLDVVKELKACFGTGKNTFNSNSEEMLGKKSEPTIGIGKRRIHGFLLSCIKTVFNPWKWQRAAEIAVRLMVVSASIALMFNFNKTRQQCSSSERKILSFVDSTEAGNNDILLTISESPLHVFCGRG